MSVLNASKQPDEEIIKDVAKAPGKCLAGACVGISATREDDQ